MSLVWTRQVQKEAQGSRPAFIETQRTIWLSCSIFEGVRVKKVSEFCRTVQMFGVPGQPNKLGTYFN